MSPPIYFSPTLVTSPNVKLKKAAVNEALGSPANQPISNKELANWDVYQCPGEKNYSKANDRTKNPDFYPPLVCSRPPSFAEKLNETFGVNAPPTSYQKGKAIAGFALTVIGAAGLVTGLTLFGIGQYDLNHNGESYSNPNYIRSFGLRNGGLGTSTVGVVITGLGLGMLMTLP